MASVSKRDIAAGLRDVGLRAGHRVLVHSSLSSLGHVEGGADTLIDALLEVVTAAGTVLVPTLTGSAELSPSNPPLFDPAHTPCWTGRIPEVFRKRPDAVRSHHPTHSVAAIGADAELLTQDHVNSLTPCDEQSPYGKLAACDDSFILLIGVGLQVNTMFHHVEEIAGAEYQMQKGFARATIVVDGVDTYRHILLHKYGTPRDFEVMEPVLEERGIERRGRIGAADVRLIAAKPMVEVTLRCIRSNPRILCATS